MRAPDEAENAMSETLIHPACFRMWAVESAAVSGLTGMHIWSVGAYTEVLATDEC